MELIITLLVIGWIVSGIAGAAKRAGKQVPPPAVFQTIVVPPEHVRHIAAPAVIAPPAGRFAVFEESTSELDTDELADDTELQLYREAQAEVHSMEPLDSREVVLTTTEARPLPVRAESLEHEVDWTVEHERFHQRYVDRKAPAHHAQRGLMDDMRDPAMLRRAVLMAEILGPPVGLHGSTDPADR
ncbi:MAG TPA: hypothetical protein VGB24_22325 [Longimicrobium sp.]|jgi:hypothetical protein|uniref:hypothetical protein n=1 Tax=Longimicrobium sp. TaxID=2029185 RepID=UPI002ED9E9ED